MQSTTQHGSMHHTDQIRMEYFANRSVEKDKLKILRPTIQLSTASTRMNSISSENNKNILILYLYHNFACVEIFLSILYLRNVYGTIWKIGENVSSHEANHPWWKSIVRWNISQGRSFSLKASKTVQQIFRSHSDKYR